MADYSYLGSGKIYAKIAGAAAPLIELGNCSALNFAVNENTIELKDFTKPGGGTYNEVRRIDSVEMSITAHDLNADNLKKALFGSSSTVAAGSVASEAITIYKPGLIKVAKPIDVSETVTITRNYLDENDDPQTDTYTGGVDFEVRPSGIFVPADSDMLNGWAVTIAYTSLGYDSVQALTQSAQEYQMLFEGLNEARSGKPVTVEAFRVKLGAAQNLSLIGEEFAALEMSGKILQDATKTGGLSQYFEVKITP